MSMHTKLGRRQSVETPAPSPEETAVDAGQRESRGAEVCIDPKNVGLALGAVVVAPPVSPLRSSASKGREA
jgi:hypothetical protein